MTGAACDQITEVCPSGWVQWPSRCSSRCQWWFKLATLQANASWPRPHVVHTPCFLQCVLQGRRLCVDTAFLVRSLGPESVQWGWCRALLFYWTKDLWYRHSAPLDPVLIPLSPCMRFTFLEWRLGWNNSMMKSGIFGPMFLPNSQNHLWSLC